jgi:hypothetical protein
LSTLAQATGSFADGQSVSLHDQGLGLQGGQPGLHGAVVCRPCQIQSIVCPADVDSLVAHASQDLSAERLVVCLPREPQGLDEITLGETVLFKVIGHPPGEAGQFCRRGEKLPADRVRIPALTQQWRYFIVQVAHNRGPGSPAAEQIVEPEESPRDLPDRVDIGTINPPGRIGRKFYTGMRDR